MVDAFPHLPNALLTQELFFGPPTSGHESLARTTASTSGTWRLRNERAAATLYPRSA